MRRPRVRRDDGEDSTPEDGAIYSEIAQQVYEQRIANRLSQSELAELCGTAQSAIARLERGDRPPRIDTLQRIADALNCSLIVTFAPRTQSQSDSTPNT